MTAFTTDLGVTVPTVSVARMREVDGIAIDNETPNLLQMMENAGRSLAGVATTLLGGDWPEIPITVFVGPGGNGGGGVAAARHLANRGGDVTVVLTGKPAPGTALAQQLGVYSETSGRVSGSIGPDTGLILDAMIGYGLRDEPRGTIAEMIGVVEQADAPVISLDVPSGIDGDTGEAPGLAVVPTQTLTLALPKAGLATGEIGDLWLADLGIPSSVFRRVGVDPSPRIFEESSVVRLNRRVSQQRHKRGGRVAPDG